jgi:vitamin K-dependent gamma-carboxylase-like protein
VTGDLAWKRVIALDARSLAVGRIAIALLIIVDLGFRASDLEAHYTDLGVMPRSAIHPESWDFLWSFHALSGGTAFEAALFAAAFAFAVAMLIGWRTRWAIAGSWLLACSLHARNPLLRDGQDDLLRVLLFFSIFLPLERCFSLDARRTPRLPLEVATIPSMAFLLQLLLVYWTSGIAKIASPVWADGGGVFYALSLSRYQTRIAQALVEHRDLLRGLGTLTIAIELVLPFVVLVPKWTGGLRLFAIAIFSLMHLGFALCLHLGIFPFLSIAAWSMMLPREFWDRVHGGREEDRRDETPSPWFRRLAAGVAGFGAILALVVNAATLDPSMKLPRAIGVAAVALGLQQFWAVFAPNPVTALALNDGWFVIAGTLENGEQVDAFGAKRRLSFDKPKLVADAVKNHRWRHYFANLRVSWPKDSELADTVEQSRAAFLDYLCRRWNDSGEDRPPMAKVKLVYMSQRVGNSDAPVNPEPLLERPCSLSAQVSR